MRRKFNGYTPEAKKRLKLWTGSFSQMILLEKRYIGKLQLLVRHYLGPLQLNVPPGTENTIHYLSGNFKRLLDAHEVLLEDLMKVNDSPGFPFFSKLGAVMLENVTRLGPIYTAYAKNYQASVETLEYFNKNNTSFNLLVDEVSKINKFF